MNSQGLYLIADACVMCGYLAEKWIDMFDGHPDFRGIVVREERPSQGVLEARRALHAEYGGHKELSADLRAQLIDLYPYLDDTELAAIGLYGLSHYAITHYEETIFLGKNLNSKEAKQWLIDACQDTSPWFFINIEQLLKPWWIEIAQSRVINTHSAVLPYARGLHAIETLASLQDRVAFEQAAGFTIHYIDAHVDTGPIIRSERIRDPFRFESIWELKSFTYMASYACYAKTASDILDNEGTLPAGIAHDPSLRGPNFKGRTFTPEKCRQAEEGYLAMKQSAQ